MLEAQNIVVKIADKMIIDDVSINVEPGTVVALCGPNGAGKSTLMRVISGEQKPSSGKVVFKNRRLSDWPSVELAKQRAKLSQESYLTFSFLVEDVVSLGRLPYSQGKDHNEIVHRCLEQVGIADLAKRIYISLSGGEKQRVHFARVLAQLESEDNQPKLLLLDEPTSALDLRHQEVVLKIACHLAKIKNFGVIVILHDLNLASAWVDRIMLLKEGRLLHSGTPVEVITSDILNEVYDVEAIVLKHPKTGCPIVTVNRS